VLPTLPARIASMLRDAASQLRRRDHLRRRVGGREGPLPGCSRRTAHVHFWKVRMKPGMPVLFGSWTGARFLGLPGNPVSVFATYATLGRRLLDGLQGGPSRAALACAPDGPIEKPHARREFQRGRLLAGDDGTLQVSRTAPRLAPPRAPRRWPTP
jgi:molybdopterin molybdotransferase